MKQSKRMERNEIRSAPLGRNGVGFPHTERTMTARLRGLLALGVCLCLALALLPAPARAAAPTTNWTDNADTAWYDNAPDATEYAISTAAELAGLAKLTNDATSPKNFAGKTVTLSADLDLSAHLWEPIGQTYTENNLKGAPIPFNGTFLGGGHTIRGMTVSKKGSDSANLVAGFFGGLGAAAKVDGLRLLDASVSKSSDWGSASLLATIVRKGATISNCIVTGSIDFSTACSRPIYVGGLAAKNSGTITNCGVHLTSITGNTTNSGGTFFIGGIAGRKNYIALDESHDAGSPEEDADGTVENCYAAVDASTVTGVTPTTYALVPGASHSYWSAASALTDSGALSYTQSYPVTAEQIAGTGNTNIGTSSTYAETPSLIAALNNWVAANAGSSKWKLKDGMPVQLIFLPDYIDINGPLNDVTHQSAVGDIEAGMNLDGQVQETVSLLSVTLPASIPFIVDVEANGAFKRVLSATGNLTNRSDTGVNITLTAVTDDGGLLDKVALSLVPNPAPAGGNVALSAGTGKTDLLAALAAPAAGVPATATVKVDGADKLSGASVGADGAQFTVGLTLKVSKQS